MSTDTRPTRTQLEKIPRMRARISDPWIPKYRAVVQKELDREAREASERYADSAPIDNLLPEWTVRMHEAQRPVALAMLLEGYKLGQAQFGKSSGIVEMILEGKQEGVTEIAFDVDELLARRLTGNVDAWLTEVTKTMTKTSLDRATIIIDRAQIDGLTVKQIAMQLRTGLQGESKARAERMARSATIWNYNEGAQEAYADNGVVTKQWLVTDDDLLCEFCAGMQGIQEEIRGDYFPAGSTVEGLEGGSLELGHAVAHPPLHPNCRCDLVPVV